MRLRQNESLSVALLTTRTFFLHARFGRFLFGLFMADHRGESNDYNNQNNQ